MHNKVPHFVTLPKTLLRIPGMISKKPTANQTLKSATQQKHYNCNAVGPLKISGQVIKNLY